jgi:hypothetical protein
LANFKGTDGYKEFLDKSAEQLGMGLAEFLEEAVRALATARNLGDPPSRTKTPAARKKK